MPAPSKNSIDDLITYKIADMISYPNMEPNIITLLNVLPSTISLYFLYNNQYALFTIFLIIRTILDALDGHVARKYNKVTDFGNILDNLLDFIYFGILLLVILYKKRASIIEMLFNLSLFIYFWKYKPSPFFKLVHDNTLVSIPMIVFGYVQFYPQK